MFSLEKKLSANTEKSLGGYGAGYSGDVVDYLSVVDECAKNTVNLWEKNLGVNTFGGC